MFLTIRYSLVCSYITSDACGGFGSLEGDVLHSELVSLRPQCVPGFLILNLEKKG